MLDLDGVLHALPFISQRSVCDMPRACVLPRACFLSLVHGASTSCIIWQ